MMSTDLEIINRSALFETGALGAITRGDCAHSPRSGLLRGV
jgi:hypothetical protein